MGSGKSRTGSQAAAEVAAVETEHLKNGIALYVKASNLPVWLDEVEEPEQVLGAVIFQALWPSLTPPIKGISVGRMGTALCKAFGAQTFVVLHLDEFQERPKLTGLFFKACQSSFLPGHFPVIPIVTGVSVVGDVFDELTAMPSRSFPLRLTLSPFAYSKDGDAFEREFARYIGVDWDKYVTFPKLRGLFRYCGGLPRLAEFLANFIVDKLPRHILDNDMTDAVASQAFTHVVAETKAIYGLPRWRSIIRGQRSLLDERDIRVRVSYMFSTAILLRRVMLICLTDRDISLAAKVLEGGFQRESNSQMNVSDATFQNCVDAGLVGFIIENDKLRLIAPLIELLVLNSLLGQEHFVVPVSGEIATTPYNNTFMARESLAMVSLFIRVSAAHEFQDRWTDVANLRPGAKLLESTIASRSGVLSIAAPAAAPTFEEANLHLSTWEENGKELEEWKAYIATTNQPGLDGFIVMRGARRLTHTTNPPEADSIVVWFSQSKKRMEQNPQTGLASSATLHQSDLEVYVNKIRAARKQVQGFIDALTKRRARGVLHLARPARKVHYVYDIFTNQLPQVTELGMDSMQLQANETILVTTNKEFAQVIGSALAARATMEEQ